MTNSIADLEEADCLFIIGSDTSAQHPLIARRILKAKEKGAKVVVADPRAIQLASLSHIYLPLSPGTNIALLNGMMKVILDEGLEDRAFIHERTEAFEELEQAVSSYSLDTVEEITGVRASLIREAALLYGRAEKAAILYAMGVTQHTTGTDGVKAVANLAMLTGNIGKPGTGVNPLRGQNNVQGACDMGALPNVFPGYQAVGNEQARKGVAKAWNVDDLPSDVGLTLLEMLEGAEEGKLKALYIMGENPMVSDPDLTYVGASLDNLDLLIVQDIFMTETARKAHIVFPSACWAEKEGTFTNTERRVQRVRKAVDPPGEAKPDWEIICSLAKAMGAEGFAFESPQEIFEEIRAVTPSYAGMTYDRLDHPDGLQWPCPDVEHEGTPILHTKKIVRGKGKFHPVIYREPAEQADDEYPYLLTTGRVTFQWHTGTMTRRSPALEKEMPEGFVEIHPKDAEELGIRSGAWVTVSSRRGEIDIRATVTDRIKEGVVFIPFHFAERAVNLLTNAARDPVAKIPELKVCAVNLSAK
jgi:formate dehydrogenase major subunit